MFNSNLTDSPAAVLHSWYGALPQNLRAQLAICAKPLIRPLHGADSCFVLQCVELFDQELQALCSSKSYETPIRLVALTAVISYHLGGQMYPNDWTVIWESRLNLHQIKHQELESEISLEDYLAAHKAVFFEESKQVMELASDFVGLAQTELSSEYIRKWYFLNGAG